MPSAASLTIADRISDPMMPELDPSLLDFGPMDVDFGDSKKDDPLNWNSQVFSDPLSVEIGRHEPPRDERAEYEDDDDNLELGLDLGFDDPPGMETGLKAPSLDIGNDTMNDGRFEDDLGYDENTRTRVSSRVPSLIEDRDDQVPDMNGMLIDDDDPIPFPQDDTARKTPNAADPRLQRDSQSPLSSARSSLVRDFDATNIREEEEEVSLRQARHRAKRRKVIQADADTMITAAQMKQQQADRSSILKTASFLSRDPMLVSLMNMQKSGGFVSSIMGDGRAKGWAPELRDILSIEVIRKAGELKRKRDSGVADVREDDAQDVTPQLEIPPEDDTLGGADEGLGLGAEATVNEPSAIIDLPADDGFGPRLDDRGNSIIGNEEDEEDGLDTAPNHFDDTTAPLLNPMEQGAVSQGTKHAVHLLRDRFGSSEDGSPSQQKRPSIMFQDMLPEVRTSKADATKMFFEVLVLATKDAIKVEQGDKDLGSPLRIRAKRNLWSQWSEDQAGGEIADQAAPPAVSVNA